MGLTDMHYSQKNDTGAYLRAWAYYVFYDNK